MTNRIKRVNHTVSHFLFQFGTYSVCFSKMLTDNEIEELISCEKIIVKAEPTTGMENDPKSSYVKRKNLQLESTDKRYIFDVFIRQNTKFINQFSIGLRYKINEKKIILIRYNGEHGQSDWSIDKHYSAFHIHKITEELLDKGIFEPKYIEITSRFTTYDSAINEFRKHVNINNYTKYFTEIIQLPLFKKGE